MSIIIAVMGVALIILMFLGGFWKKEAKEIEEKNKLDEIKIKQEFNLDENEK